MNSRSNSYKYKVSIIIPVYQVEHYIQDCLNAVFSQTYQNLEIIFVDDRGTDRSMEMVRQAMKLHPEISSKIITHAANSGLSAARNSGLRAATGDYVYFLDSDDFITPDCIESLILPLQHQHYEVVIGSIQEFYENGNTKDYKLNEQAIDAPLESYAVGQWYVMAWNKLCNRDFLLCNNLFFTEGLLHEDVIWSFQLACRAHSLYTISHITYSYRIRQASIMTGMSIEKDIKIYLQAFAVIKDFVLQNNLICNPHAYRLIEGKKCGILYSLLQIKEYTLFNRYYPQFHQQQYISPIQAYRSGIISFAYLLRDLHYSLSISLGCLYKKAFYWLYYRIRGKAIEGAVWK